MNFLFNYLSTPFFPPLQTISILHSVYFAIEDATFVAHKSFLFLVGFLGRENCSWLFIYLFGFLFGLSAQPRAKTWPTAEIMYFSSYEIY